MPTLDKQALLDYIKSAIGLENDIAIQQEVFACYDRNSLTRKPTLRLVAEPTKPVAPNLTEYTADLSRRSTDSAGIMLIPAITLIACGLFVLFGSIVAGLILMGIGAAMCMPYYNKKKSTQQSNEKYRKEYESQVEAYEKQLKVAKEKNQEIREQYNSDLAIWQSQDSKNRTVLRNHLVETQELLRKLYSLGYIYDKYCNLPALTSIYEYLLTGRCEELAGPHGAYNMYEDELRKDTVISQLNTVIENLEQIKQNQYMLYQQVKAIQRETAVISSEITQIKGYTAAITQLSALNAYYSALTARNTEVTMAYHLLS